MIAIVDYGVGNLFSLSSSVKSLGAEARVTRDAADLRAADHILLPGVGAFADAMAKLEATGLVPVLREETQKKPLLGICLGMQLLFEESPTSAGTLWTLCPGARPTRCSSTSKTASMSIMYTAITPKTALHRHWQPVTTASP